ncbi:MAG: NAD(P)/FAD-dependent oxidoreductase [Lachnospiraceae bacterium]|nr:NAD(P)/FAD-dependent oxidoreductase [Lachnospiraceae bacterium]
MERYDVIIIGTGPAGISAAITLKMRRKNILLLGPRSLSHKIEKAQKIDNYPGLPGISGEDMQKKFLAHIRSMDIEITEDKVNAVYSMGEYFAVQGHKSSYEADAVILAAGMYVAKPYDGEQENLGRGVSYCATCDAALYKGKSAIVIAHSQEDESEAEFLAQRAENVYYIPMYEETGISGDNIEVVKGLVAERIEKRDAGICLITDNREITADGIFILREQVAPSRLVPGMEVSDGHVNVDRQAATNIKGLFACGDITGPPYQYVKAAGEGNVAALSAVRFLAQRMCNVKR